MQGNLFGYYESCQMYLSERERSRLSPIAMEVHLRLIGKYVLPDYSLGRQNLLDQLIYSLLSQRTRSFHADNAFTALRTNFQDWISLLTAPVDWIEELIAETTYPEQKAPRLRTALHEIFVWNNRKRLSLDFLHFQMDVEAGGMLRQLPGVGHKTSNATLLLSQEQRPVLPVDTHGIRVRKRLGTIANDINDPRRIHAIARAILPADWDADDLEREYYLIKRHGQNCCTHNDPNCHECPLLDLCKYGRMNVGMSPIGLC